MKLTDQEPQLVRLTAPGCHQDVATLAEAQGVEFLCPCGDHHILVWFRDRDVPSTEEPGPARWTVESGTGLRDLTLSPSIHLLSGCKWHGFVRGGEVVSV